MGILIMVLQLLLSLSILVVLHEGGHFAAARWFKTRVEKFYLFFNPYFSLFKKKIGETEYGIGWLPLGGYVKIAGMIDESFDKEQMKQEPQPWEFRSKPAWQRLIIMLGGVIVNFIVGYLIFMMMAFVWGKQYLPPAEASYGLEFSEFGKELGFENGDMIKLVGDEPIQGVGFLQREIYKREPTNITVSRNGRDVVLPLSQQQLKDLAGNKGKGLVGIRTPFIVDRLPNNSPNANADLRKGDRVMGADGNNLPFYSGIQGYLNEHKEQEVLLNVLRGNQNITVPVQVSKKGKVGVHVLTPDSLFNYSTQKYGFFQSIPQGIKDANDFMGLYLGSFKKMFQGKVKASESLGGFGTIASMFGDTWNWKRFWMNTGILSLILAIMNLLPIPLLDGGHVMFLLYEMITGRKPNDKFMEYAQLVGLVLLVALMLYANGMDIFRAFK